MAPLERYFKLPREKRDRLLHAARGEFAEHGFERASFNRIIAASGVSKGAMYYYFADKADLFGAVLDELLQELIDALGPLRATRDASDYWAAIEEWTNRATLASLQRPELLGVARCLYADSGAQQTFGRLREQVLAVVIGTLETGQALGAVRTDVPLDMLAMGMTHMLFGLDRWFAERFEHFSPAEIEHLAAKTLELCRDVASPKPATTKESLP